MVPARALQLLPDSATLQPPLRNVTALLFTAGRFKLKGETKGRRGQRAMKRRVDDFLLRLQLAVESCTCGAGSARRPRVWLSGSLMRPSGRTSRKPAAANRTWKTAAGGNSLIDSSGLFASICPFAAAGTRRSLADPNRRQRRPTAGPKVHPAVFAHAGQL